MLIVDNIDGLILKQEKAFYDILNHMMANIHGLKILMTSFSKSVPVQLDFTLKVYELGPLEKHHVSKLLMARCPKQIGKAEIEELFRKYPLPEVNESSQKTIRKKANLLMNHPLIKFFEGHP